MPFGFKQIPFLRLQWKCNVVNLCCIDMLINFHYWWRTPARLMRHSKNRCAVICGRLHFGRWILISLSSLCPPPTSSVSLVVRVGGGDDRCIGAGGMQPGKCTAASTNRAERTRRLWWLGWAIIAGFLLEHAGERAHDARPRSVLTSRPAARGDTLTRRPLSMVLTDRIRPAAVRHLSRNRSHLWMTVRSLSVVRERGGKKKRPLVFSSMNSWAHPCGSPWTWNKKNNARKVSHVLTRRKTEQPPLLRLYGTFSVSAGFYFYKRTCPSHLQLRKLKYNKKGPLVLYFKLWKFHF